LIAVYSAPVLKQILESSQNFYKFAPYQKQLKQRMNDLNEKFRKLIKRLMEFSLMNRWIILLIDLAICMIGYALALYIQQKNLNATLSFPNMVDLGVSFFVFTTLAFMNFKSYQGLIRHSNFQEMWRPFVSLALSSNLLYIMIEVLKYPLDHPYFFVLDLFLLSFIQVMAIRFFIVTVYNYTMTYTNKVRKKMLVYDTNTHSIALAQWINQTSANQHQVVGFLSRDTNARRTRINELPVYLMNSDNLDWFMRKNQVSTILFPDFRSVKAEDAFVSKCIDIGLNAMVAPPLEGLGPHAEIRFQMRPIQFEDLLGRDEIQIDLDRIGTQLDGKVILITGAAGSIGSGLVAQIARFNPKLLIFFDVAETPMHTLRMDISKNFPDLNYLPIIGDVRNQERLEYVFREYRPQLVYHAAAYKHVPLMEENPCESILVNVLGTMNLSKMAVKYNVERFVMISTDKAVNPTNIMGASKRLAEIYVQALAKHCEKEGLNIKFMTTRFGNVLGSNGSVIPYFKEQIEHGGPVTVTDPRIIRYFMTIPEACRLVLEAASFGENGQIYVFDMGSPVKIDELAKRMIELAGYIPGKDIKIEYIGLRPGEKLYEELLNDKETTVSTKHEKITVAKVRNYDLAEVEESIKLLIASSKKVNVPETVKQMKRMVPEFKSQNSPYSAYDI
jgi:FlaA1/EpsC-like NDP-sugar epimerase